MSCVVSSLDCIAGTALRGLRVGAGLVVVLLHKHFGGFVVDCLESKGKGIEVRVTSRGSDL